MIKPKKLNKGDKIATISLSWGGAGELPHRYKIGKKRIEENFELEVIETTNSLKSAKWIYDNPQARVDDLNEALLDDSIKAIISNIGGDDSIRLLKYIDLEIIRNNPKIFLGFSDSTITHFCFYKAGVTSFYGTSTMVGFAENVQMHEYQTNDIISTLFNSTKSRIIKPNKKGWTSEMLDWSNQDNQNIKRNLTQSKGWRFLQGKGKVQGKLLGGCLEVMENLKDTRFWVKPNDWVNKIMFIETSDFELNPEYFRWVLRNYAASGILHKINGILMGRPYNNKFWKEYDQEVIKIMNEEKLFDLPIIAGMDFGHTCPTFTLPYGIEVEIDMQKKSFKYLESPISN